MKLRLIRSLITLLLITLLFAACGNLPGSPIATIAATADLPEISTGAATITQLPAPETQTAPPSPAVATPAPDLEATSLAMTEVAYAAIVASPTATTPTPEIPPTPPAPLTYTFEIVNTFPHDPGAFTEGLVYQDGILFEGTGLWGQSDIREVELETGEVIRSQDLEAQYFGEGVTLFNGRIYQLTWQEHTGFIYEPDTFDLVDTFDYPTEGWGLTHNGQELIMSDGTSTIFFLAPETLQEARRITVRDHTGPVNRINEMEYINGEIWANIWLTDLIARISPDTGNVLGYVDLTGLLDPGQLTQEVDVLNGIAYDAENERLFVTGKYWPSLFEIEVVPAP